MSSPNYKALAEFRVQIRKFLALSSDAARQAGIDPTQHQLLLLIKASQPQSVNVREIAERLLIRQHSAAELVSRCERNGWVEKQRDEGDRRQVLVTLTENGDAILAELTSVHTRELQAAGPLLIESLTAILNESTQE